MVIAPFALHYDHTAATTNGIIAGLAIAAFSYIRLRSDSEEWVSWALAGMGLWLVFSPFMFHYAKTATYWNELLFGLALLFAMFSALGSSIRHHSHLSH